MDRNKLRKSKIQARNGLTPDERDAFSAKIAERIIESEEFRQAETIMIYKGIKGEVRLEALEQAVGNRRLAYPLCISSSEMVALVPQKDAWQKGAFGISEPVREKSELVAPEDIDLVICPCTVFDEECNRMGMGGGFYDRYLPRCTNARIVAVAFEIQKTGQVPMEAWDIPMSAIFTEVKRYG